MSLQLAPLELKYIVQSISINRSPLQGFLCNLKFLTRTEFNNKHYTFRQGSFYLESAARLERKSFFVVGKAKAKRLGVEDGYSCPNDINDK